MDKGEENQKEKNLFLMLEELFQENMKIVEKVVAEKQISSNKEIIVE